MKILRNLTRLVCALTCMSLTWTSSAMAQASATPIQLLDTLTLTGKDFAIKLSEEGPGNFDPLLPPDSMTDPERDLGDCVSSNTSGLTCLDRDNVRHWPNPISPHNSQVLFNCAHADLPFNTRKGNGCTAIDRDSQGAIYLGGRLNGTANILIKVVENTGAGCPAPATAYSEFTTTAGDFCWATIQTGRPRIEDIDVVEGSKAKSFADGQKQLVVLEEKKTVLIYSNFEDDPRGTAVDEIASGKRDFDLNGNEQILNAALVEYVRPDEAPADFFIVVATDLGRLITIHADGTPSGVDAFDLAGIPPVATGCPAGVESFDVIQGTNGGLVYATDASACALHVLTATSDMKDDFAGFTLDGSLSTSTDAAGTSLFAPVSISVFPGIGFDLEDCFPDCTLISSETGVAASLQDVMVATAESGVVLFHVTGLPHCAWIPRVCVTLLGGSVSSRDDAVAWLLDANNIAGSSVGALLRLDPLSTEYAPPAEELIFNVTPYLPAEVTDQVELTGQPSGGTPPLLFGPEYRAQIMNGFLFDALFFVPEPNVATDGVLTLEVDVGELTGSELGCGLPDLLAWDITIRASERFPTFDADHSPAGANFQATMVNAGCGSTRSRTGGVSVFPVNFELTPCPVTLVGGEYVSDSDGECVIDGDNAAMISESADDSIFAKLYVKLYDELLAHLQDRACEELPPGADNAPLKQTDCTQLEAIWFNGKDKLVKAINATIQPKTSAGSENFGSVQAQVANYRAKLLSADTSAQPLDVANRVGEQEARLDTLEHLLNDKLLPSIPAIGFIEDDNTWAQ